MLQCTKHLAIFHTSLELQYLVTTCVFFGSAKIEKEKKKLAQDAGCLRTEVTGGEVRAGNCRFLKLLLNYVTVEILL